MSAAAPAIGRPARSPRVVESVYFGARGLYTVRRRSDANLMNPRL